MFSKAFNLKCMCAPGFLWVVNAVKTHWEVHISFVFMSKNDFSVVQNFL